MMSAHHARAAIARGSLVAVASILSACAPPRVVPLATPSPPQDWIEAAPPLPNIPKCRDAKSERDFIACRAGYDAATRTQYVDLANRHGNLAAWSARVSATPSITRGQ